MAALAEQISAYRQMLPQLRKEHGSVWALLIDSKLVDTFQEFQSAAMFALEHFEGQQFLIRHTDEQQETIPFVIVEG
jgi:hypothetical protein